MAVLAMAWGCGILRRYDDMAKHHEDLHSQGGQDTGEVHVFFSRPFLVVCSILCAVCAVVLSLCGWIVTDWVGRMESEHRTIQIVLGERATLPYRVTELEKRTDLLNTELESLAQWRWQSFRHR